MPRDNQHAARVWLAILKEGGRLKACEAASAARRESGGLGPVLAQLVRSGALKRYEVPGQPLKFGVTADCVVPLGVTIADILACEL